MPDAGHFKSATRWPDVIVGVGCVLLTAALAWIAFAPRSKNVDHDLVIQQQLRSIHQAMLLYGFDNGGYLPGLNPDGSLFTNNPADRYDLLVNGNLLPADQLVSPADARPAPAFSYAISDLSEPGDRRDAWTVEPAPDAPILAESPAAVGRAPDQWSGHVLWHRPYLTPGIAPRINPESATPHTQHEGAPRLRTRYTPTGPHQESDHLFTRAGPDDAHLIAERN
ncbi:MAG: hypothetical protein AAGH99_16065 [Planctomycetota bacterium]